jgi:putative ABC transport system ATP-binding protein
MLQTSDISHHYSATQRFAFPDILCQANQTLLILGQSGVGKTTLLHILAGILQPDKGSVQINTQSLYDMGSSRLDQFRGQHIGLVFQKPHFIQSVNAEENLWLAQKIAGKTVDKKKATRILEQLKLDHKAQSYTYNMSQGEQQRLSIARAIINDPQIILADEPTSALDDVNCQEVVRLLEQQAKKVNACLIVVTHDNRLKSLFNNYIELS